MPQTSGQLSRKAKQLEDFLREEALDNSDEVYIKGKFIADDVGLSTKEIGQLMLQLQEKAQGLEVEKWSYTAATTWRVALN